MSLDIYKEIIRIIESGSSAALSTLVSSKGSVPRHEGTKMIIYPDGRIMGTIGGGLLENEVIRDGLEVIKNNANCLKEYQLTPKESEGIGMTCGGNAVVFIEPISPLPRLMIIGAGHVAVAMVPLAKRLGFQVSVAEDRAEYTLPERFPEADEVSLVPTDKIPGYIQGHTLDYVVLVNRQSSYDPDWLKAISQKQEAKYIGCIGSRMRAKSMLNNLRKLNLPEEFIQSIHTPIGIEINAETPEEIALSILAEITSIRRANPST